MDHETLFVILSFFISSVITLSVVTLCMFFISRDMRVRAICAALLFVFALIYVISIILFYQVHGLFGSMFERIQDVSYTDIHDGIFRTLRIHTYECRVKFVCELSKISTSNNKDLASFIQISAAFGGFEGDYISGFLGGLSGANCSNLYADCEHSPLEKTFPFLLDEL